MRMVPVVVLILLLSVGCGGSGAPAPNPVAPLPPNPDIAILFVSGHQGLLDASPSLSYLHEELGPRVIHDLQSVGYTVDESYYVDHPTATDAGGYEDLVASLQGIRDDWVIGRSNPTRVIVVAHSHGGVWATAAIRQVSNLTIRMQVALDHSSYGWGIVNHDLHHAVMGGDPRDAYMIPNPATCPLESVNPSEAGGSFDLEDVVFANVQEALEVRSGENPGILTQDYDERWNSRRDGSGVGLACFFSNSSHDEPRLTNGVTYPVVINWILGGLESD